MRLNGRSRQSACALGVVVAVLGAMGFVADDAEKDGDWLHWRGPDANGMARGTAPVHFGDEQNIKWMIEVPGRGFSTPIIVGDRIFLTTAIPTGKTPVATQPKPDETGSQVPPRGRRRGGPGGGRSAPREEQAFVVICLDRHTGSELWRRTAHEAVPAEGYHRTYGSYASIAPVSDGERVYVSFGSFGLFCYDLEGTLIWKRDPGIRMQIRLQFGEGSAPVIHKDALVHMFDHQGQSRILVFDKNTGEELWRKDRDEPTTWAMPLVTEVNGRAQIITSGSNRVRAYDLETGEVIWECGGLGLNAIPSPVREGDVVLAMTGFRNGNLMAVRLGGEGDLTGTDAVVWQSRHGTSYTPQPLVHDGILYTLMDRGMLSAFDAATGEPHYLEQRLPRGSQFKASPVGADGKIYLAGESGDVYVVRMGPEFELLATNTLTDQFFVASPVIAGGDLFLRSRDRLYCIGEGSE